MESTKLMMESTNRPDYSILSRKYRRMGLDREADLLRAFGKIEFSKAEDYEYGRDR